VGYVCNKGQARIALDVGQDVTFFSNPDLPDTHSEMALPLIASGRILGALDVQSTDKGAFTEDDVSTLQILADQLSVAIENANLFAENQAALASTRRAFGDISRSGWQNILNARGTDVGYISVAGEKIVPAGRQISQEFTSTLKNGQASLSNQNATLHLPIKVRGNVIGVIRLDKQMGMKWSPDEMKAVDTLSDQLGGALESARLFNDISQRAERESIVADITSKIVANINVDTILASTVDELSRLLGDSEISIQLQPSGLK
jgi:GAF domain-containing protein